MPKKQIVPSLIVLSVLLFAPTLAHANVNVNISGNATGSQSSVSVNSTVNSTSTSSNNSVVRNDIRVESNGVVKEYHGSDANVQINNGSNSVSINYPSMPPVPTMPPMATPRPTVNPAKITEITDKVASTQAEIASAAASATSSSDFEEIHDKQMGLIEYIKQELTALFQFLTQ